MPTIPEYLTPQVSQRPIGTPYSNVNQGTGAGQAADAVFAVADKVAQTILVEKAKADTAAIVQAEADYRRHLNGLWADPKEGLLNYKGAEMQGRDVAALKNADETQAKILAGLKNDEQRAEFSRRAESHRLGFSEQVDRYAIQQRDIALGQSVEHGIQAALDEAAINFDNRAGLTNALRGAGELVAAKAKLHGFDERGRQLLEQEFKADVATRVLDAYLAQDRAGEAKAFLAANRDVLGDRAAKYEKAVRGGVVRDQARAAAEQIWLEAGGDLAKAEELAKDIKDTEVFDAVNARLEHQASLERRAKDEANDQRLGRVFQGLERTGFLDQHSADFEQLDDVGKAKALERAKSLQRQSRVTSAEERRLQQQDNREAREAFLGLDTNEQLSVTPDNVSQRFPRVDELGRAEILHARKQVGDQVAKGLQSKRQEVLDQVNELAAAKNLDKKDTAQLRAWAMGEFGQIEKPTQKDVGDLLRRATEKVMVPGRVFGAHWPTEKDRYKVRADEQVIEPTTPADRGGDTPPPAPLTTPAIPADVRRELTRRLEAKGLPATEARLRSAFDAYNLTR